MSNSIRKLFHQSLKEIRGFVAEKRLDWLPIRHSFTGYNRAGFIQDAKSGLNVALLALPQGMAYAVVAGLPIFYGITCSIVASIVAPLFSGSRHTILGPTNATAFMIFSFFVSYPALAANKIVLMPLVVLLAGLLLILGAYLRLADLIQYISRTVVIGYISGAALLIIANQLRHVLGVEGDQQARSFFTIAWGTISQIPKTNVYPLALGVGAFLVYTFLNRRFHKLPVFAIALVLFSVIAVLLERMNLHADTFAHVDLGALLPDYSVFMSVGLIDSISPVFSLAMAVAFLASLENSVMAKTLAARTGDRPDMNQDMLSVGVTNVATSLLSGMPASGSLTRSALNFSSGAVGRVSSIISGLLCALGLVLIAPHIDHVPKAVLAALVIAIAFSLINFHHIKICMAATRSDAITLLVTFISTLIVPLHVAIFIGVGTAIMLYLRKAARPQLVEYEFDEKGDLTEMDENKRQTPSISIVHVEGELFFGAAELFRTQIQRTCNTPNLRIIILRLKNARHLDATSVMALEELIRFLRLDGRDLIVSGAMKEVYRVLKNSGLVEVLGKSNIFLGSTKNPNISTRNALLRAQEILGTKEADVRIYYDPNRPRE
jgi:SulP family sulfate permease